jgi:ankyrin repeat protein
MSNNILYIFSLTMILLLLLMGCSQQDTSFLGFGRSPFLEAVESGDTTAVGALLNKGANPNEADDLGWTALMNASGKGYINVVKMLLDKGANVNAKTLNGWTALMRAAERERVDIVELLLKRGANFNVQNKLGMSPLMLAVESGNPDTVKILLTQKKIDLTAKDKSGRTALSIAKKKKNVAIISMLNYAGAKE